MLNQQLIDYISESISSGITKEEVIKILLGVGWSQHDVDAAFVFYERRGSGNEGGQAYKQSNADTHRGDGSWINTYDLGLPHSNSPEDVKKQSNSVNTEPEEVVSDKVANGETVNLTQLGLPEKKVVVNDGISNKNSNLRTLLLLGAVFIVLGIIGIFLWWFVNKNDVAVKIIDDNVEQIDSKLDPQNANELTDIQNDYKQALSLSDIPYISSSGFQIIPPASWLTDDDGAFETLVIFTNPYVDEEMGNKYSANINVVFEQNSDMNYEQYLESSRGILKENFPSYSELSKKDLFIDESSVVMLEGQYEVGAYSLHNIQLIVKVSDGFYVITGTTLESVWNTYQIVLEESLLSFSW